MRPINWGFFGIALGIFPHAHGAPIMEWDSTAIARSSLYLFQQSFHGEIEKRLRADCKSSELEAELQSTDNASAQREIIEKWHLRCDFEFAPSKPESINAFFIRFLGMKFGLREHPRVRKVKFRLSRERYLRGLLALKTDPTAFPLVVVRTGIFGDAAEGIAAMMGIGALYDEGPFHVLILPSVTGRDYALDSGKVMVAGFEEALLGFEALEALLAHEGVRERVSEIHFLGFSLGAHATLYSSLFRAQVQARFRVPLGAALGVCPVVNLAESLESILDDSHRGAYYGRRVREYLDDVSGSVEAFRGVLPLQRARWTNGLLRALVEDVSFAGLSEMYSTGEFPYAPFSGLALDSVERWRQWNAFKNYEQDASARTLLIYNQDDMMVLPELNANTLREIPSVGLRRGNHCGLPAAYGWASASAMLRGYFLGQSRMPRPKPIVRGFEEVFQARPPRLLVASHVAWRVLPTFDRMQVRAFPVDGTRVRRWSVPLRAFAYLGIPGEVKTMEDAARISRFFNSHVEVSFGSAWPLVIAHATLRQEALLSPLKN